MPRKTLNELRSTYISETDKMGEKQRWALFSIPPSIAIGEDTYTKKTKVERDENGKPKTEPPNVKVAHPRTGKFRSSYFSYQKYIGDKYQDPQFIDKQKNLERMAKIPKDNPPFKDASGWKTVIQFPYKHMTDRKGDKALPKRDDNGRVLVEERNVQTN